MKKHQYIKTGLVSLAVYASVAIASISTISMAHAADYSNERVTASQSTQARSGIFIQKSKTLKGDWTIVESNGQTIIRFNDDFKAKRGPDLKVFLSPQDLDIVSGETATNGAILLGKLKSAKGRQDYILPAGVNLAAFSSVLIHCEAYSVLWGGSAL